MSCCCITVKNLCKVPACDTLGIKLPDTTAASAGVYTLKVSFLGAEYIISSADLEIEADIIFSTAGLNEFQEFTGKVYDPAGEPVLVGGFECIQFTVIKSLYL